MADWPQVLSIMTLLPLFAASFLVASGGTPRNTGTQATLDQPVDCLASASAGSTILPGDRPGRS